MKTCKSVFIALDEASEGEVTWGEILHDLKARGLRAPRLAIADRANSFGAALAAAYPDFNLSSAHSLGRSNSARHPAS